MLSWIIYQISVWLFICKMFITLSCFPVSIPRCWEAVEKLAGWHFIESKKMAWGCTRGVCLYLKPMKTTGLWLCRELIHPQINNVVIIRQLLQMTPRTFRLSLCLLQRCSCLLLFSPSIDIFSYNYRSLPDHARASIS